MQKAWKISVDTGGTFTDCIAEDTLGKIHYIKVLSSGKVGGRGIRRIATSQLIIEIDYIADNLFRGYTLEIPSCNFTSQITANTVDGVFSCNTVLPDFNSNAVVYLFANEEAPVLAARIATKTSLSEKLPEINLRLGTTRGTNALLEMKGGKTALIVTKGFKDLMEIGTQQRPDLFALNIEKRKSLAHTVIEIDESIDADGKIIKSIDIKAVHHCIRQLKQSGCDSIAIAFKNSFKNNANELQLAELLTQEFGNIPITSSALLYPAIKYLTRTETAVINAYLTPVLQSYLADIATHISAKHTKVMTSAGALTNVENFQPKDSLLSGPAGGIVGASAVANLIGASKVLTIDMGGTSTDVSRIDKRYDTVSELTVGNAHLFAQAIAIETVAAGGGSICALADGRLTVGPASAGAYPGPACYGNGGPLTITDINLLSGRIDAAHFSFPLDLTAAENALNAVLNNLQHTHPDSEYNGLISGFLAIANQKMADAVKKISINRGFNPKEYQLLGFGGAIGQHICDIAQLLQVNAVIVPYNGSLLSAAGIAHALLESFEIKQLLIPLSQKSQLLEALEYSKKQALAKLMASGAKKGKINSAMVYLRLKGQDSTLEIPFTKYENLIIDFKKTYTEIFGHWVARDIEVESVRANAIEDRSQYKNSAKDEYYQTNFMPTGNKKVLFNGDWHDTKTYNWPLGLESKEIITGPAVITNPFTSIIINPGWSARLKKKQLLLTNSQEIRPEKSGNMAAVDLALFTNRFKAVAEQMGSLLQRTALSVNIKERLDFSCALLDRDGRLVVNAPHIPVHLGSLGICTRAVLDKMHLDDGDVVITNHPAYGGSHLPDVTLIAPVYHQNVVIGYVANRAHHAEIGGKAPGSMPADAASLAEEGVVIAPMLLVNKGLPQWDAIKYLLASGPFPSRAIDDNIADFQAALASILAGQKALQKMATLFGQEEVLSYMHQLSSKATRLVAEKFKQLKINSLTATENLDDGAQIHVKISAEPHIKIDFTGTSATTKGNLNATEAIVNGAVIYVLKLLIAGDIPLNEGLTREITLIIPKGSFLNPVFPEDATNCPAVVGGNTEVSQRLVDTLLKAFGLAACSQGTMNNFLFGNGNFGYYETICGGTGAGYGFHGADAVHQHMTNTKITDPEILEFRYPVELTEFSIRTNSGGAGKWQGGNGVVRSFKFKAPVIATILSQHRIEAPYGLAGGGNGAVGHQELIMQGNNSTPLQGVTTFNVGEGDSVTIYTPGGGGYGNV